MLIQSDVSNIPDLFLRHPDWQVMYDIDPQQAIATRHKFYDMAAAEKATIIGFHFPFPSIGHVERRQLPTCARGMERNAVGQHRARLVTPRRRR